jgi:hypothetical protein
VNVSTHLPLATVPVQLCPEAAFTVTLPATAVAVPLLTVKDTVTLSGFVPATVLVIVVVVFSMVAVVDCSSVAAR